MIKIPISLPVLAYENVRGVDINTIAAAVRNFVDALIQSSVRRVLLIPPDHTRANSGAGMLTKLFYACLTPALHCDILPALGSHRPMVRDEQMAFFGADIPEACFLCHSWRTDTDVIGMVPAKVMARLSKNRMNEAVPVEINRRIIDGGYDHILSIGQVVPHEVAGMANYTKNILVGCGGADMIDASHMLSVYSDYEDWMGCDHSPVRALFDYAQRHFLDALPITYIMTVVSNGMNPAINGLYIGGGRDAFEKAVTFSQQINIIHTGQPVDTCVVYLPAHEFRSAWLGNKAVYRTRKALARDAQLIVLAPGFERFGEDEQNDVLIRRYGYRGREALLALYDTEPELHQHKGALAHMIHGSADGRFRIRYCTKPRYADDIRNAGYEWGDIETYSTRYGGLQEGWNHTADGEVYCIHNPALGLWTV